MNTTTTNYNETNTTFSPIPQYVSPSSSAPQQHFPSLPILTISDALKCCIEKTLHDIDIHKFKSLIELKKLFQPCEQYHTDHATSILTPVIAFFTSPNKSFEEKICRQAYCKHTPNNWNIFYIHVLILTLMVAVLGNTIVLAIVVKDRRIRKRATNFFLLSLAISDFFCSVSMLPVKVSTALTNGNFCNGIAVCQFYHTADHMFFAASVTHLFVICIDRYMVIVKPYKYLVMFTHHRRKWLLILIWLYSALWAVITSFNRDSMSFKGTYYISVFRCKFRNTTVINVMYLLVFFIPCIIMAGLYGKIWWIAVSQAKVIRKQHKRYQKSPIVKRTNNLLPVETTNPKQLPSNRQKHLATRKLELKATKMILTVFGTFLICWSPVIFLVTINSFKKITIGVTAYKIFCEFLPNLNSALNPFIYCFMYKDFRQGLKYILQKMSSRTLSLRKPKSHLETSRVCRNSDSHESASYLRVETKLVCAERTSSF